MKSHKKEHENPKTTDSCFCCIAEKITVTCGSDMEAKQYEYNLKSKHEYDGHEYKHSDGEDLKLKSEHMSHQDHEAAMSDPSMAKQMEKDMKRRFFISFILSIPVILYSPLATEVFGLILPSPIPVGVLLFLLTTPIVLGTGNIFVRGAYNSLKAKKLNMSVLISTGVLAAYLFSIALTLFGQETFYEAAAMLVTFVLFGHWMEMKSRRGTSDSLRALFDLVPPKATVIKDNSEMLIDTAEIILGDIVLIKPGDKIPVDGEIIEGETSIDESLVTGESLPVSKQLGDKVIGGSINQAGSIKFRAMKVGGDTALAQIVKLVETAQNSKAPGQRIADKAAAYLVILAVGSGIITFSIWYIFVGQPLLFALTFAISAIIIACPDALGLATPTVVAVGTGLGAKNNILIKDAVTLEQASKIQAIVLDKTGTLTQGKPKITDVIAVNDFSEEEILLLDAAAEKKSGHPLSTAVLEEVERRNLQSRISNDVTKFKSLSGHGVVATVAGKEVLVGTAKLMRNNNVELKEIEVPLNNLLEQGKTIMLLAINKKIAGVVAAMDPVKESAKMTISMLNKLGIEAVMITGDNFKTAEHIAKDLNIKRFFAEVLPEDKANHIKQLQSEGKFTAMVGDGVNDAPALAQADVGIAIGAGTDVAIETADIVLMKSDPLDVLNAIKLSKATVTKMKQNLVWASVYNVLAIPIAAGILYPAYGITLRPEISALLMSASSIIVATNAVLLKRVEKNLIKVSND